MLLNPTTLFSYLCQKIFFQDCEQPSDNEHFHLCRVVSKESCCPGYKRKGQGRGKEKVSVICFCHTRCLQGEGFCHQFRHTHGHLLTRCHITRGKVMEKVLSPVVSYLLSSFVIHISIGNRHIGASYYQIARKCQGRGKEKVFAICNVNHCQA